MDIILIMSKPPLNKILYLEDSIEFQQIVGMTLIDLGGYDVKICSCGAEVLEIAENFNPDLFLLDIIVPDISGPDLLKKLRKIPLFEKTPTVFISANFTTNELMEFSELGVIGIVRKPFDPISLPETIEGLYQGNQLDEKYLNTSGNTNNEEDEENIFVIE